MSPLARVDHATNTLAPRRARAAPQVRRINAAIGRGGIVSDMGHSLVDLRSAPDQDGIVREVVTVGLVPDQFATHDAGTCGGNVEKRATTPRLSPPTRSRRADARR